MQKAPKIQLRLSPEAEKYVRKDAPTGVRRLAAGGALPLPPVELVTVLFVLSHDSDAEVKSKANASLEGLPESVCQTVMSSPDAHPAVLHALCHIFKDSASLTEALALNAAADDQTFVFLASLPHRRVVDIVANNQERMLRCDGIAEALGENPLTGRATIDRILSFLGIGKARGEEVEEEVESLDPSELTDSSAAEALRAFLGADAGEFARALIDDTDCELSEEEEGNLFALLQRMSVMQKIKLARLGNKEARSLLVRDHNKLVAAAAIRSPKVTDNEIEGIAKARNVSDEVLRIIAANREWTRNYSVKRALATNPKCPIQHAMKFLNFMQEKDLRSVMRSKDVPAAISTHARRLLQKKGRL
ncbi:MAG: hypothetical protein HKP27_11255 [Myxococcales bacterium]|nr:hypothetical protein [Myxococcales bacterium]